MALFPPKYLDTVVALGRRDSSGALEFTATGFLYGHPGDVDPSDGERWYQVFLVTNRHVAEGGDRLVARLNGPAGSAPEEIELPPLTGTHGTTWTLHPGGADVAVFKVSALLSSNHNPQYRAFQGDNHTIPRFRASELDIGEGTGVFILGFPMGLVGADRNFVVVRKGILARVQDWLQERASEFLIDAFVFPGNSGGPIVTEPEFGMITGTKPLSASLLIGMVSRYITYQDIAVSPQTGRRRVVFEENSGLVRVVPVDVIDETIEHAMLRNAEPDTNTSISP